MLYVLTHNSRRFNSHGCTNASESWPSCFAVRYAPSVHSEAAHLEDGGDKEGPAIRGEQSAGQARLVARLLRHGSRRDFLPRDALPQRRLRGSPSPRLPSSLETLSERVGRVARLCARATSATVRHAAVARTHRKLPEIFLGQKVSVACLHPKSQVSFDTGVTHGPRTLGSSS